MATAPDPDDTPTPPRGRESWLGPKGSRKRTALQVGIALLALLVTFLIYRASRRPTGGYGYPQLGATGGADMLGGLGDQISAGFAGTNDAIRSLTEQIGGNGPHTGPTTPPKTPPKTTPTSTANRIEIHRIGVVGQTYSLRTVAARYAPSTAPDAIEAMLRRLVAANPYLAGRTTVPGGYALRVVYKPGETAHA